MSELQRTPLRDFHAAHGARLVDFAGWEMPVQYRSILEEHKAVRRTAGLFDVSHMGQLVLSGEGLDAAVEAVLPIDLSTLNLGQQRYSVLLDANGGILDDLMFTNRGDHLYVVVNAACKAADIAHMTAGMPGVSVEPVTDRALLALQGPQAVTALLDLTWYSGLIQNAYAKSPTLQQFDRVQHEYKIKRFRELDLASLKHAQTKLAA